MWNDALKSNENKLKETIREKDKTISGLKNKILELE